MIDVHVPQKAEHTWTDFFIHIGTIAVGLLLAIALEQGVEWLHHRHERAELIAAMRAEAQSNRPVFEGTISAEIATFTWDRSAVAALTEATPQNGMVDVILPPHPAIPRFATPARATWTIANTNGKAALLPDNLAETYNRLNYEADLEQQSNADFATPTLTLQATTIRLGIDLSQATRLHLSVADRDAVAQALAQVSAAWFAELRRLAFWRGANNAVADGVQSWEAIGPYMVQSMDALQQAEAQAMGPAARSGSAAPENPSAAHAQKRAR